MPLPLAAFEVAELPRRAPAIGRIALEFLVITVTAAVVIAGLIALGGPNG